MASGLITRILNITMLLHRILTAICLQTLLVTTLFAFDHLHWFDLMVLCAFTLMMWEWNSIAGPKGQLMRIVHTIALVGITAGLYFSMTARQLAWPLLLFSTLLWFLYVPWMVRYPKKGWFKFLAVRMMLGLPMLVFALYSLYIISATTLPYSAWLIFAIAMVVAAVDVGSYFAGRLLGNAALAPHISPKKTVGGLIGGLTLGTFIILCFGWGWAHYTDDYTGASHLMLALLFSMPFAVGGDLIISMLKRHSEVKDTGSILPGHGGMLDRLDGVLAAAPPYALALMVAGLI
jgi:phosphatidate cytidylyltransferase